MPTPLTEEQLQQVSRGLERTDSAPAEPNSKMLALASGRKGKSQSTSSSTYSVLPTDHGNLKQTSLGLEPQLRNSVEHANS
jgi:hypothetical protein